jgi:hypothetical protein
VNRGHHGHCGSARQLTPYRRRAMIPATI